MKMSTIYIIMGIILVIGMFLGNKTNEPATRGLMVGVLAANCMIISAIEEIKEKLNNE